MQSLDTSLSPQKKGYSTKTVQLDKRGRKRYTRCVIHMATALVRANECTLQKMQKCVRMNKQ
jgi:hypothetical protein